MTPVCGHSRSEPLDAALSSTSDYSSLTEPRAERAEGHDHCAPGDTNFFTPFALLVVGEQGRGGLGGGMGSEPRVAGLPRPNLSSPEKEQPS